jgi:L-rhamnose mutarotase
MPEIALHTRLRPDGVEPYEQAHRRIPEDLLVALRRAGVRDWRIWRDGLDLFHLVDVDDYAAMRHALRDDPANIAWQERLAPFFDVADDYSGQDEGIARLWTLAEQLQDAAAPGGRDATARISAEE